MTTCPEKMRTRLLQLMPSPGHALPLAPGPVLDLSLGLRIGVAAAPVRKVSLRPPEMTGVGVISRESGLTPVRHSRSENGHS
jgi:hypothetical protein